MNRKRLKLKQQLISVSSFALLAVALMTAVGLVWLAAVGTRVYRSAPRLVAGHHTLIEDLGASSESLFER